MDTELIIYGFIGIVLLLLVLKLFKWPLKILINGVIGVILLFVANYALPLIGLAQIAINPITALIAGILGVPGVIVLIIFNYI